MRIAIESTLAQGEATGLGQYVRKLLEAMAEAAPENEYLLFHASKSWGGPRFGKQFRPVSYRLTGKQSLDIALNLNRVLRREKAELFHATCTTGTPPFPAIPCVATIHDIYPLIAPHDCKQSVVFFFKLLIGFSVRGSKRLILNSAFTEAELRKYYELPLEKTTVVHLAPCLNFERSARQAGDKSGEMLCVGAIEPRKGQLLLAKAFKLALQQEPSLPPLHFAGPDRGDGEELARFIVNEVPDGKARWSRFLPEESLKESFHATSLFVCPSLYEGFGIPLIEASSFGIPALCSDIPVFREVNGEWPIYVKPDVEAFAKALVDFRAGRFDEHFATAKPPSFSWRENALATLRCYKEVLA